eukprot:COSAG02_NODE_4400_length_5404_cov_2.198680_7_plen_53_part_00
MVAEMAGKSTWRQRTGAAAFGVLSVVGLAILPAAKQTLVRYTSRGSLVVAFE